MQESRRPLQKMPTGIGGFDDITRGGLPHQRMTLIAGGPGSGKTIFALQSLVNGAQQHGEPGIFVAFEEHSRRIIANAATFGWDLPAFEHKQLFFLDAEVKPETVQAGGFDLNGMLAGLQAKVAEMGAKRIVFDSIDVLLSLLNDPVAERRELYRLHNWLGEQDLTGLITAKVGSRDGDGPNTALRHYDFLQFMVDCVVLLKHEVQDHTALRHLRVLKYRGSNFAENEMPLLIGPHGIEVASVGQLDLDYPASTERVSTGVAGLDEMLQGGYYRGSSTLITGTPGTAKTTLSGAFTAAACARGERVLFVSFDEGTNEIVRNLASVGIQLAAYRESGHLHMASLRSEAHSAEAQLLHIRRLLDMHQPAHLVIDPLSAILKAGRYLEAEQVAQRLVYQAKTQGMTTVITSLLADLAVVEEVTPLRVSTLADTWIHLSYLVQGGERNRALTIVKSRGTAHSNQVRELLLSEAGVGLDEIYTAGGAVLMGTLRWEREQAEAQAQETAQREMTHRRRELTALKSETQARVDALEAQLALRQVELDLLAQEQTTRETKWREAKQQRKHLRSEGQDA